MNCLANTSAVRADRDHEPFFTMLSQTFGWVPALEQHRLTLIHVDDDSISIAKVRPEISMLRLRPQTP